jgi:hypothetical protein
MTWKLTRRLPFLGVFIDAVHGTWVSGRRIPPNTPVDLATGDTLRLGASKREYKLLWLSLREAFEMDDLMYMPSLPEEDKEEPYVKVATI